MEIIENSKLLEQEIKEAVEEFICIREKIEKKIQVRIKKCLKKSLFVAVMVATSGTLFGSMIMTNTLQILNLGINLLGVSLLTSVVVSFSTYIYELEFFFKKYRLDVPSKRLNFLLSLPIVKQQILEKIREKIKIKKYNNAFSDNDVKNYKIIHDLEMIEKQIINDEKDIIYNILKIDKSIIDNFNLENITQNNEKEIQIGDNNKSRCKYQKLL